MNVSKHLGKLPPPILLGQPSVNIWKVAERESRLIPFHNGLWDMLATVIQELGRKDVLRATLETPVTNPWPH